MSTKKTQCQPRKLKCHPRKLKVIPKLTAYFNCSFFPDDMYHILTDLPETVPYYCLVCDPIRPAKWQIELAEEMQAGFLNVMTALFACRSAAHLIWPEKRVREKQISISESLLLQLETFTMTC